MTKNRLTLSYKKLIFLLVVGVAIYILASSWVGFDQIIKLAREANLFLILLAVIFEICAYFGTGYLILSIFDNLKIKSLSFLDTFRLGTVSAMAIHIFPIAGFGEAAFGYYFLKQRNVPVGNIIAMIITRLIFSYSAFFIILATSLLFMPILDDVSLTGKIASVLVFLILLAGILFARALYLNFNRFYLFFNKIVSFLDHIKKIVLKKSKLNYEQKVAVIKDIHQGFSPMDSLSVFTKQTAIALIYWLGDILALYLIITSLGVVVHPAKLVIAYGIATTLGAISFIPGGLGVVEGALGLMLVNIGLPIDVALLAVIGYRLISFWFMIPVGIYSAIKLEEGNFNFSKT